MLNQKEGIGSPGFSIALLRPSEDEDPSLSAASNSAWTGPSAGPLVGPIESSRKNSSPGKDVLLEVGSEDSDSQIARPPEASNSSLSRFFQSGSLNAGDSSRQSCSHEEYLRSSPLMYTPKRPLWPGKSPRFGNDTADQSFYKPLMQNNDGYPRSPFATRGRQGPSYQRRDFRTRTLAALRQNLSRLNSTINASTLLQLIPEDPAYGAKTIGQVGSFIYLVNQIFGAGILALPYVLKASGWLPCFFANLLVALVGMFGTLMIMRSMTMIQGNQNFERRIEYIPTVEYFLGKRYSVFTEVCFYLSIQSMNVVSIAVVAQTFDHLLLRGLGLTGGLTLVPSQFSAAFRLFKNQSAVDEIYAGSTPDGRLLMGVTFGYILNAIICMCLSSQSMEENMRIQYVSFAFLVASVSQISASAIGRIWQAKQNGAGPRNPFFRAILRKLTVLGGVTAATTMGQNDVGAGNVSVSLSPSLFPGLSPASQPGNVYHEATVFGVPSFSPLRNRSAADDNVGDPLEADFSVEMLENPVYETAPRRGLDFSPAKGASHEAIKNAELNGQQQKRKLLTVRDVRPPSVLGQYQYGQLLSTFIAAYSYVNVIPSWANEMQPSVKVNHAVWSSTAFACIIYYIFGFVLAYAYPTVHTDNILEEVLADNTTGMITRVSIYVFNLLTVMPGILVYSITTRYNIVNSGQATPRNGFLIGCVAPFFIAWLLTNDEYFSAVLTWSSLLFSLAVNFVIPLVVYLHACQTQRLAVRNPTRHSQALYGFAKRTEQSINDMVYDVSSQLRAYLHSLPSADLDPHVRLMLNQPSPSQREALKRGQSLLFGADIVRKLPQESPPMVPSPAKWNAASEEGEGIYGKSHPDVRAFRPNRSPSINADPDDGNLSYRAPNCFRSPNELLSRPPQSHSLLFSPTCKIIDESEGDFSDEDTEKPLSNFLLTNLTDVSNNTASSAPPSPTRSVTCPSPLSETLLQPRGGSVNRRRRKSEPHLKPAAAFDQLSLLQRRRHHSATRSSLSSSSAACRDSLRSDKDSDYRFPHFGSTEFSRCTRRSSLWSDLEKGPTLANLQEAASGTRDLLLLSSDGTRSNADASYDRRAGAGETPHPSRRKKYRENWSAHHVLPPPLSRSNSLEEGEDDQEHEKHVFPSIYNALKRGGSRLQRKSSASSKSSILMSPRQTVANNVQTNNAANPVVNPFEFHTGSLLADSRQPLLRGRTLVQQRENHAPTLLRRGLTSTLSVEPLRRLVSTPVNLATNVLKGSGAFSLANVLPTASLAPSDRRRRHVHFGEPSASFEEDIPFNPRITSRFQEGRSSPTAVSLTQKVFRLMRDGEQPVVSTSPPITASATATRNSPQRLRGSTRRKTGFFGTNSVDLTENSGKSLGFWDKFSAAGKDSVITKGLSFNGLKGSWNSFNEGLIIPVLSPPQSQQAQSYINHGFNISTPFFGDGTGKPGPDQVTTMSPENSFAGHSSHGPVPNSHPIVGETGFLLGNHCSGIVVRNKDGSSNSSPPDTPPATPPAIPVTIGTPLGTVTQDPPTSPPTLSRDKGRKFTIQSPRSRLSTDLTLSPHHSQTLNEPGRTSDSAKATDSGSRSCQDTIASEQEGLLVRPVHRTVVIAQGSHAVPGITITAIDSDELDSTTTAIAGTAAYAAPASVATASVASATPRSDGGEADSAADIVNIEVNSSHAGNKSSRTTSPFNSNVSPQMSSTPPPTDFSRWQAVARSYTGVPLRGSKSVNKSPEDSVHRSYSCGIPNRSFSVFSPARRARSTAPSQLVQAATTLGRLLSSTPSFDTGSSSFSPSRAHQIAHSSSIGGWSSRRTKPAYTLAPKNKQLKSLPTQLLLDIQEEQRKQNGSDFDSTKSDIRRRRFTLSPQKRAFSPTVNLLAPPNSLNNVPVEPPIDLMVNPVVGAEDAYECDEVAVTGDLKPIRIHVFPKGFLRTYHLATTKVLIALLVGFCVISVLLQLAVDWAVATGRLTIPSDSDFSRTAYHKTFSPVNPKDNRVDLPPMLKVLLLRTKSFSVGLPDT